MKRYKILFCIKKTKPLLYYYYYIYIFFCIFHILITIKRISLQHGYFINIKSQWWLSLDYCILWTEWTVMKYYTFHDIKTKYVILGWNVCPLLASLRECLRMWICECVFSSFEQKAHLWAGEPLSTPLWWWWRFLFSWRWALLQDPSHLRRVY